ncbi:hypothetical protein CHUAL_003468 [Chamberlinius hualienensis]
MYDEESDTRSPSNDGNSEIVDRKEIIFRAAADLALSYAKLPKHVGVNISYVPVESEYIHTGGLLTTVRLINNENVQAVVGVVSAPMCRVAAAFARLRRKMFVSWGCAGLPHFNPLENAVNRTKESMEVQTENSSAVNNPTKGQLTTENQQTLNSIYLVNGTSDDVTRYFYRISPSAIVSARALVQVIKRFGWKQSAIITVEDDTWLTFANAIDEAIREEKFIVRHFLVIHKHADPALIKDKMKNIVSQVKAILLCVPLNSKDMRVVMQTAENLHMFGPDHAFIAVHVRHPFNVPLGVQLEKSTTSSTPNPLVFTFLPPDANFVTNLRNKFPPTLNTTRDDEYHLFLRVYDCMALLLKVLTLRSTLGVTTSSSKEFEEVAAKGFLGPILSTTADGVKVDYTLLYYEHKLRAHRPLLYVRNANNVTLYNDLLVQLPPSDPSCMLYEDEQCVTASSLTLLQLIVIVVCAGLMCLGSIFIVLFVRKTLKRRELTKGPYGLFIYPGDLVLVVPCSNISGNKISDFHNLEKPDLLKGSHDSLRGGFTFSPNGGHLDDENERITRARYNGDLVMVKHLHAKGVELKNKAIKELKLIHDLRHENINPFLGFFVNPERSALVFEYCTRGSLQDVLSSDNIKLDWSFKLSLLTDLVRGMKYLHSSPVRVHGRLTSNNCVIDARWVLKVTDYGLPSFYAAQGLPFSKLAAADLLWTSPELLRSEGLLKGGTQPGDVYSFSIIMQEMLVRGPPYCMLHLKAEEIIEKVMLPPPMIRPSVSKQAAPPEAINIMRECWAEVPDMRPDFSVIYEQFKRLNHGKKVNIVDTMFQMLEKYSNNLEEIIRDRTEQLGEEKKKTEQLLHRMLPSSVAERLKMGLPVEPESYEEVTIYFSDIVGFTTISAYSTPMEVVDLLNDLYTCFDATINAYDVYKVETIGDAYMVVGGLPVRNTDNACQVADMALDLLHQSGKFKIRHLPQTPLKLRIGIHTGPCCSGVVGQTMPRYCLFGDTVNTASRMESTSYAWRIHISQSTKEKLDTAGGYHIVCRGQIELKGKGVATTYWLLGKDGFDKLLPIPQDSELDEELIRQCIKSTRNVPPPENAIGNCVQSPSGITTADVALAPIASVAPAPTSYVIPVVHEPEPSPTLDLHKESTGRFEHSLLPSISGISELKRRSLSNASDLLALQNPTIHSSDVKTSHSQNHLHCIQPQLPQSLPSSQQQSTAALCSSNAGQINRKALEYIPNANSYLINMNRAHSLDSSDPAAVGGSMTYSTASGTGSRSHNSSISSGNETDSLSERINAVSVLNESPKKRRSLAVNVLQHGIGSSKQHMAGGIIDNQTHQNRRSSEIWESNFYSLRMQHDQLYNRNQNSKSRRFSNPKFGNTSDERNGNFLKPTSMAVAAAGMTNLGSVSPIALLASPSHFAHKKKILTNALIEKTSPLHHKQSLNVEGCSSISAIFPAAYQDTIPEVYSQVDNHVIDSSV